MVISSNNLASRRISARPPSRTKYTYDRTNNLTHLTAYDLNSDGTSTTDDNQVTTYSYDDSYNASLVTKVVYPDSTSDTTDCVSLSYYLDGSVNARTTQAHSGQTRNVITMLYDSYRRLSYQSVTTPGTNVDDTVQSIKISYNSDTGRAESVTSYGTSDATGVPLNQVAYTYHSFGAVEKEYQAHSGVVDFSSSGTPYVQYGFDTTAANGIFTNALRTNKLTYPNGREINYHYHTGTAGTIDDKLSRLRLIKDHDSTTLLYAGAFAGSNTTVYSGHLGTCARYSSVSSPLYSQFDRYGRTVFRRWFGDQFTDLRDDFSYAYDHASNRVHSENMLVAAGRDWGYDYDGLNRLQDATVGTLDNGSIINGAFRQQWGLDTLGNWGTFNQDDDGDGTVWELQQARSHNLANELTGFTAGAWRATAHDARGNMITMPRPGGETTQSLGCVYDAWNRLVLVYDDANHDGVQDVGEETLAEYHYDGLNRRIRELVRIEHPTPPGEATVDDTWEIRDDYYNSSWQLLETRLTESTSWVNLESTAAATTVYTQYVWSPVYIDALILRDRDKEPLIGDLGITGSGLDERLVYCFDANYNVTSVLKKVGTAWGVCERYAYDPYGKVTVLNGTSGFEVDTGVSEWSEDVGNGSDYDNEILYCGYRFDPETGMYHVRNRYYLPTLGRWGTRDKDHYMDGASLVAAYFVPNATDPLGLGVVDIVYAPAAKQASEKGYNLQMFVALQAADKGIIYQIVEVDVLLGDIAEASVWHYAFVRHETAQLVMHRQDGKAFPLFRDIISNTAVFGMMRQVYAKSFAALGNAVKCANYREIVKTQAFLVPGVEVTQDDKVWAPAADFGRVGEVTISNDFEWGGKRQSPAEPPVPRWFKPERIRVKGASVLLFKRKTIFNWSEDGKGAQEWSFTQKIEGVKGKDLQDAGVVN